MPSFHKSWTVICLCSINSKLYKEHNFQHLCWFLGYLQTCMVVQIFLQYCTLDRHAPFSSYNFGKSSNRPILGCFDVIMTASQLYSSDIGFARRSTRANFESGNDFKWTLPFLMVALTFFNLGFRGHYLKGTQCFCIFVKSKTLCIWGFLHLLLLHNFSRISRNSEQKIFCWLLDSYNQPFVAIKENSSGLCFFWTIPSKGEFPRYYLINVATCLFCILLKQKLSNGQNRDIRTNSPYSNVFFGQVFVFWRLINKKPILCFWLRRDGPQKPNTEQLIHQTNSHQCFIKTAVFKSFTIFTGKHLCWSLFLIKLPAFRPATSLERYSKKVFGVSYFGECFWTALGSNRNSVSGHSLLNHLDSLVLQKYQSLSNQSFKYNLALLPSLYLTPTLSFELRFRVFFNNGQYTKRKRTQSLDSLSFFS